MFSFLRRRFAIDIANRKPARHSRRGSRRSPQAARLSIERLEDRSLLSAGDLDPTFGGDGTVTADIGMLMPTYDVSQGGLAMQADGKIVQARYSYQGATGYDFAVVRYNEDGTLDTTFSDDGKTTIDFGSSTDAGWSVAVDASPRITVVGYSYQGATGYDFAVARLNNRGNLDVTFDDDGKATIDFASTSDYGFSVAIDGSGGIVVSG